MLALFSKRSANLNDELLDQKQPIMMYYAFRKCVKESSFMTRGAGVSKKIR